MNNKLMRPRKAVSAAVIAPITLVTLKSTSVIYGEAQSTTGYIKVMWWDSTTNVYGVGNAVNTINWSKAAGGAGEKTVLIYPSDATGNPSGAITVLGCSNNEMTSLDVSGSNALTSLTCNYNQITSLDISSLTSLVNCYLSFNWLSSLTIGALPAIVFFDCSHNQLTSLDVSSLTAMMNLWCMDNAIGSLNVSNLPLLNFLDCRGCFMSELRAQNVSFTGGYYSSSYYVNGANIRDNLLSAAALNQFYTDLGAGNSPILVTNNPGTSGDDPAIATAKGYTVYGS